ncbi:hypothetical protein Avbf_09198, partial [Armadillidium vulgare]
LRKECHEITKYETVIREHDAIYVKCMSDIKEGLIKKSYKNVHLLVQDKRKINNENKLESEFLAKRKNILNDILFGTNSLSVQDKRKNNDENKSESEFLKMRRNKLSVIMFGTDSVSRLNFLRTQPKTYQYLTKELKAFEYKGYNKVGENTFPNVIALLTGKLWDEDFAHKCFRLFVDHPEKYRFPFDDCPFIWKDFQRAGYMTALVEEGGILNKSILFYMSDHGMRFGNFRHTDLGKYEDNLPYLFIVVPEWFRKRFVGYVFKILSYFITSLV